MKIDKRSLRRLSAHLLERASSKILPPVDPSVNIQEPPPLRGDHQHGPPDFVGIGAQKCGTTWWHKLMLQHPEIYDNSHLAGADRPAFYRKERHFFDRFFARPFSDDDALEYHRWFARPKGMIVGEWTPRYLVEHWAPRLLFRAAPDARLLVMLRDPVERFASGMRHALRRLPTLRARRDVLAAWLGSAWARRGVRRLSGG